MHDLPKVNPRIVGVLPEFLRRALEISSVLPSGHYRGPGRRTLHTLHRSAYKSRRYRSAPFRASTSAAIGQP